ncbi:hypothetical protein [Coralloluteibacterium stylophorae]|uniref:Riboflavin biosynthesis protein RibA n=1 Tax=Coralloluteibacterium stylophorae TaxID=1776034 RepID=A0A8J8AW52_9GAMM|nr:hypothetical protein [Coralloluteibacterium stylophorae]MBS7457313.1 hypothetical protein [Coralloluteibacterium stylophorae]
MEARERVLGEASRSKVVATFANRGRAQAVAEALRGHLHLAPDRVTIAAPGGVDPGRAVEPEQAGIARTAVRAHVTLGILGAVVGALVFVVLLLVGVPAVVASPGAAAAVIIVLGTAFGMLLGGLVTLRPDHDRAIERTHEAVDSGRTALIAHAASAEERARMMAFLEAEGGEPTRTL